jgi:hypothetical protein
MAMPVQEPLRFRKALLAGIIALALTGTGAAIAWSATDTPSPSPSASAPGKSEKAQRPQHLHSESVVKEADGTFETVLTQQGTVDAVSDTSVTVKSEDGFTQTYAVNADTKIVKFPAPAADGSPATGDDGKRLKRSEVTMAEIAKGEVIRVTGVKDANNATARQIVEGTPTGPGKGLGKGHSQGHGHAKQLSPR